MSSIQTAAYGGRYLKLTVVEESWSASNNTSTARWTLESIGGTHDYYSVYNWGVWVGGHEIYGTQTTRVNSQTPTNTVFPAAKGSTTGTITVNHNADGSAADVGFTLKGSIYNNNDNTYTGKIPLTHIPRYATITTHQVNSVSQDSISIKWNADVSCSEVQYSLNGGGWTAVSGYPVYTISGLESGTNYTVKTRVKRTDSGLWSESGTLKATTTDYVVRLNIDGTWKNGVPYIKVDGTWKKAIPYIKANSVWKKGV